MSWPVALGLAVACACVGAVGQWIYGQLGIDLELMLLARARPGATNPPLPKLISLAVAMAAVGVPASAVLGHGVLRVLGLGRRPLGATFRVTAFASVGALGKLVPFVGYFVALAAILGLSVLGVRGVHGLKTSRAVLVIALTTMLTVVILTAVLAGLGR